MTNITSIEINKKKIEVPGKWIDKDKTICSDVIINSEVTYSLSEYLPNDDYVYEVQFEGWTNNNTRIIPFTDKASGTSMCILYGIVGASVAGNIILPIGKRRKVGLVGKSDQTGKIGVFRAKRYRRLYKDED